MVLTGILVLSGKIDIYDLEFIFLFVNWILCGHACTDKKYVSYLSSWVEVGFLKF